jgi:hypothetical protein
MIRLEAGRKVHFQMSTEAASVKWPTSM